MPEATFRDDGVSALFAYTRLLSRYHRVIEKLWGPLLTPGYVFLEFVYPKDRRGTPFEGLKEPTGSVIQAASSGSQTNPPAFPGDTYLSL